MKQLKRIKRITLLPVIIAAFIVAIFAGIFLSFRARENKISASASSSVASFTAGASIGMSTSTADMIRFRLNISDTSEIESITVSVNPFKGCVFEGADMYTYTTNKGTAQIDISDGVL